MQIEVSQAEYRVELPIFRGPLDLLLYLVKKHEVDILDIPISTITAAYLRYLEVIQLIDVEAAGDFLVVASTLMEIKSRMMLPHHGEQEAEAEAAGEAKVDPRAELVKQLVAYRRYREAADELDRLSARNATRWPRGMQEGLEGKVDPALQPVGNVELWDLVSAFDRLLRATLSLQSEKISVDETPQEVHTAQLLEQLERASAQLYFEDLFQPPHTKGRLIGIFLALLELIKQRRILVIQEEPFGRIQVALSAELGADSDRSEFLPAA